MNNYQYVEKILLSVERIILDTSVLMSEGFLLFVSKYRSLIKASAKNLYVHNEVYKELARHLSSGNPYKVKCALAAIELMVQNKDIFVVEATPLTDEEIEQAFADPQLLSELTLHRMNSRQLLISNDHKLCSDAFELNRLESCHGHKVYVCYISWNGQLNCCECARAEAEPSSFEAIRIKPTIPVKTEPVAREQKPNINNTSGAKEKEQERWELDWKSVGIGAFGAGLVGGLGYAGYKLFKSFIQYNYRLEVVR